MRTLALALTLVLVFAACGSSKHSTAPTNNGSSTTLARPAGAPNVPACTLVTQADATTLFGHPALLNNTNNPTSAVSSCVWQADTNPDPNALDDITYLLQARIYNGEEFYGEKYLSNVKKLSGIGDKAFVNTQGPLAQVEFVKHGRTVTIAYSIEAIAANPKPKASDQQDALIAIARAAASRY
jgi:hypothetical protein